MSINDPLSPIRLQLMWDRLIAVVEEQALALMRTGFSTSTREAGDLSAGVFDLDGAMLAQAVTGTPGHINSMARAVYHRDDLVIGSLVPGPAVIAEDETTTIVPKSFSARISPIGAILMEKV